MGYATLTNPIWGGLLSQSWYGLPVHVYKTWRL